jgi:hypothetical protein
MTQLTLDDDPKIGQPAAEGKDGDPGIGKVTIPIVSGPGALDVYAPREGQAMPEQTLGVEMGQLAMEIEASLDDELLRNRKGAYPREKYAWASELHHPCLKELVHARRDWKDKKPMDADGLWRVGTGIDFEGKIRAHLQRAGYELIENQGYIRNEKHMISGRMDGMVLVKKKLPPPFESIRAMPLEVKTINPMYWDSVKDLEGIKNHRGWWIRKYPSQLNFYIHEKQAPAGLMLLGTFGRRPRIIPMLFDEGLWQADMAQIDKANAHLAAGTLPAPLPFDAQICGMCDFSHICNPLRTSSQTTNITPEDEIALNYYLDLKKDFDEIKGRYEAEKNKLIGDKKKPGRFYGQNAFVSDIEISTKDVHREGYEVKATDYKVTTIERIGPNA